MINVDRKRFIKQHIELYGKDFFIDLISRKCEYKVSESSKIDLLNNLYSKIGIELTSKSGGIKNEVVFGSGDPNADLLIVGEFPSDYDIKGNRPFLGNSGKLLDKILDAIGFSRSEKVYLTYLIKYKIDDSRYPLKSEINKSNNEMVKS